jgi:hypothetical protein
MSIDIDLFIGEHLFFICGPILIMGLQIERPLEMSLLPPDKMSVLP